MAVTAVQLVQFAVASVINLLVGYSKCKFTKTDTFVRNILWEHHVVPVPIIIYWNAIVLTFHSKLIVLFSLIFHWNFFIFSFFSPVTGREPHCERPNDISLYYLALALFYLYLFGNFFVQNYFGKKNTQKLKSK